MGYFAGCCSLVAAALEKITKQALGIIVAFLSDAYGRSKILEPVHGVTVASVPT